MQHCAVKRHGLKFETKASARIIMKYDDICALTCRFPHEFRVLLYFCSCVLIFAAIMHNDRDRLDVSFVFTSSNYCCFWLDCNNTERPSMITCMHAHTNSCDDVVMQPIMVRFINTILLTACEFIWLI